MQVLVPSSRDILYGSLLDLRASPLCHEVTWVGWVTGRHAQLLELNGRFLSDLFEGTSIEFGNLVN